MNTITKILCLLTLTLLTISFGADDYVIGEYEHIDKLKIQENEWSGYVVGEGKYIAGFVECFYDNISENYRNNPSLRAKVLAQMEDAKKSGEKRFNLYRDEHYIAWKDTIGKAEIKEREDW